jgi:hypothetical protein
VKWKYAIEVEKKNGNWSNGTIWAVAPSDFRTFLRYINGEDTPDKLLFASKPVTRVKRVSDDTVANYEWPQDRKVYPDD